MTAYIKLSTNEYPRHVGDIEIDPAGASDYTPVQWVDQPTFDYTTQRCQEGAPVQENGVWKITWVVRDATPEEIDRANNPFDPRGNL
jgi:hypothetical protein